MKITLYYFKIPFWRAEVTRLSLFIGDIPFIDHRIEGDEYDEFKKTGKLTEVSFDVDFELKNKFLNIQHFFFTIIK